MQPQNIQKPLTQEEIEEKIRKSIAIEVKLINKNNTLATATITMINIPMLVVSIKGFLIFNSTKLNSALNANINIVPPSRKVFDKYYPLVFFGKRERWDFLQKLIFEKYISVKEEQLKQDIA